MNFAEPPLQWHVVCHNLRVLTLSLRKVRMKEIRSALHLSVIFFHLGNWGVESVVCALPTPFFYWTMRNHLAILILLFVSSSCATKKTVDKSSVTEVMDAVITRLYHQVAPPQYASINDSFLLDFLTPFEKAVLASRYQYFTVNVPTTVSLMRDSAQSIVPFWIEEAGFVKTPMVVRNEVSTYEVWQKDVNPGIVTLGINGFDKHRPVYFISVAPKNSKDVLKVTDRFPNQYPLDTLERGAFVYHDWSDLVFSEVPTALSGQVLFTTVRGRAREAHIIDAFRKTPFPSSTMPDQIMLTWRDNPHHSIEIQWRTDTTVQDGTVQYWKTGTQDTLSVIAEKQVVQDRMLYNDRYIYRYTAHLTTLSPGVTYGYRVGSDQPSVWSPEEGFSTEGEHTDSFSFVWFGDTHCFPDSGRLVSMAERKSGDAVFYGIAGDMVSTGLYRDDWDKLFEYAGGAFARKPLMPALGNHDRQDGLGAQLYYDLFSLPQNAPPQVEKEASYFFEYGNSLFVMIDATSEVDAHTQWLEETLRNSKATWKFVMFHFPPYNFEEPYLDIQRAWVPLFDQYHVDMVMGGHIHYYMRSRPMNSGHVVADYSKGTVYAISISIPNKHPAVVPEPYAATQYAEGYFYQYMQIDGKTLHYSAIDNKGVVRDEFVIEKK